MKLARAIAAAALLGAALPAAAQTGNPNPKNFQMLMDGGQVPGIAGFAVDFEKNPVIAYSPRRVASPLPYPTLTLTVTPKGLAALSSWINDAGSGATPATKSVEIQLIDNSGTLLVDWRLDGVQPVAILQDSSGVGNSPTASVILAFEKLTLVSASSN